MGDTNKQICRLCLEVILDGDCEIIEEIKKEILEILLINIDFDVSDNAVACNRCLGKLQDFFDFKSTCFYVNDYITPFVDADVKVDIKNVFKKVVMTSENESLDSSQICRLCMSFIEDEAFNYYTSDLKDGGSLEDLIRNCLPEVNLNSVHEPLICKPCLSNMTRYYEFMTTCKKVEQRIKNYFQEAEDHGSVSKVILEDVLEFKHCSTPSKPLIIKQECVDVENVTKFLKNGEAANIKCEEIEIKDELDNRVETTDTVQLGNCSTSGKNTSLKRKRKVGKSETKGKTFFCPKCPYSANKSYNVKLHMRSHSDNEVCRCTLCSFVTDSRLSLKAHLTKVHRGPTKAFGCHECTFETDHKSCLEQHLLKHKDKSEVEMQQCSLCPYKTKYKAALLSHRKLEHTENIKMYKCEKCSFTTKHRLSLVGHQLLHRSPEEIPKHKCEKCDFVTSYKTNLGPHMLTHEDLEVVSKFKCGKCPYRGKREGDVLKHMRIHNDKRPFSCDQCTYSCNFKENLKRHKRVHEKDSVRQMYKCKLCDYQAKTSVSIKDHMSKIHTDPSKLPTFKCALCPYEITSKKYLARHMTRRHNHKDQPTLKCELCLYVTTEKESLRRHSLIHQEATIKCDQCDFWTKHKNSLQSHMRLHDPVKPLMFKCDKCEYSTWQKGNLNHHKVTHMELGETTAYKCSMCDFQTKYKYNLKDHTKTCLKRKEKNDKKKKKIKLGN